MDLCYEALNGSCGKYVQPNSVHVPKLIAVMLITFLTVIGNLLVIISIGHFKQLYTPTNQLILSLALCDFLLGMFIMPLSAVRSIQGCWYFGDFLCKLHTCVDITLSTSSIFHLVSVSAERCCAVCGPLTYHSRISFPTVLFMIFTSWLIPAIFAYAIIFFELNLQGAKDFYETHVQCVGGCHVFFSHGPAVVTSLVSFYIPSFIILGIYSRIYMVAQNQARSINHQLNQFRRSYPSGSMQRRALKATITIAIVVGVFLVCWTPFFLCNILNPFIGYTTPPMLIDALVWFGYVNSALNPFIYAFMYSWFRKAVRIIVTGEIFQNNSSRKQLYL
ncbi:trace amine-associated receptor 1b [Rhinichthys klamathensis goyatoka]|uniref:trace amine-associated receptor 1b n=1 Tax=Rhinichthys klamathensis goyatoka TaxID=3034132 RepID=UPI0024B529F3|nr:trace amine-associated receptor 1b [Rhinichthys klamathensis goyatoka]